MLHALGITHVVSVGECALVPPLDVDASATSSSAPEHQVVLSHGRRRGSLWREEREGRIKVLDIKVGSLFNIYIIGGSFIWCAGCVRRRH